MTKKRSLHERIFCLQEEDISYNGQIQSVYGILVPGGFNLNKNTVNRFLVFINLCVYIIQFIAVNILTVRDFSLLSLIGSIESSEPIIFASIKCITLCIKFHDMQKIFVDLKQNHWDITKSAPNKESRQDSQKTLNLFKYFNIFLHTLKFFIIAVFMVPLIFGRGDGIIPYEILRPKFIPPLAVWTFQFYMAWSMYFYNIGFDVFIFTSVMLVMVQFKLINAQLTALDFSQSTDPIKLKMIRQTIKKVVNHHNWLMKIVKDINDCVSLAIMVLFLVEAFGISMELYSVSVATLPMTVVFRAAAFAYTILFQFFFIYCLPSDILQEEAHKISFAIYKSNWYTSKNTKIVKDLKLIMSMSTWNNNVKLKGWKLFDMNLPAFTMIARSAMSYYTLLKTFTEI